MKKRKNKSLGIIEENNDFEPSGMVHFLIQQNAQEMKEGLKRDIEKRFREMLKAH